MIGIFISIWMGLLQTIVVEGEILDQNGIDAINAQDGSPLESQ